ncbi:hypothetical protein [Ramlibacter sp.]|uniref:hypothetical protein n=1 Tax=Ramlibacter sp. TaxID=1917967 RepID=UPI003D1026BD
MIGKLTRDCCIRAAQVQDPAVPADPRIPPMTASGATLRAGRLVAVPTLGRIAGIRNIVSGYLASDAERTGCVAPPTAAQGLHDLRKALGMSIHALDHVFLELWAEPDNVRVLGPNRDDDTSASDEARTHRDALMGLKDEIDRTVAQGDPDRAWLLALKFHARTSAEAQGIRFEPKRGNDTYLRSHCTRAEKAIHRPFGELRMDVSPDELAAAVDGLSWPEIDMVTPALYRSVDVARDAFGPAALIDRWGSLLTGPSRGHDALLVIFTCPELVRSIEADLQKSTNEADRKMKAVRALMIPRAGDDRVPPAVIDNLNRMPPTVREVHFTGKDLDLTSLGAYSTDRGHPFHAMAGSVPS